MGGITFIRIISYLCTSWIREMKLFNGRPDTQRCIDVHEHCVV